MNKWMGRRSPKGRIFVCQLWVLGRGEGPRMSECGAAPKPVSICAWGSGPRECRSGALPPDNKQTATPPARVRYNTKARPPPNCLHFGGMVGGEEALKELILSVVGVQLQRKMKCHVWPM